ncbi:hypothetical protein HEP32_019015 [Escherichia coli]|nr:hypothetical protein [Escherichia coli]MBB8584568.1 hypothetical protein [Escherichia coli]HBB6417167.1 hypothetical protein [Escherichia coli]
MNVFEMEGFLRGKCVPRDLKVNETNAEYLVRKFDALEAKCETLATENARLNKFIVQSCYVFNGEQDEISDAYICATDGGIPQIPATDAFLAEVKTEAQLRCTNQLCASWKLMCHAPLAFASKESEDVQ